MEWIYAKNPQTLNCGGLEYLDVEIHRKLQITLVE